MSAAGKVISTGVFLLTRGSEVLTGTSITRVAKQQKPYPFGSWKAPKGYTNCQIMLPHARGYLLKYTDGMSVEHYGKKQGNQRIVYQIHGGGYVGTFSNLYNKTALHFSRIYEDADVFSLDYRTAPAHVYPCALEDAIDGYRKILEMGYDPGNMLLCGESAGAGLCLSLCLWLRDHDEPLPGRLVLSSPWTDLAAEGDSYQQKIKEDVFFGSADERKSPRYPVPPLYAGKEDKHNPYISPAYGDYTGFPPMLIQTGEAELLLSDSDAVVRKAKEAEADVTYFTYPGMYHTFYIITPDIPESRQAWKRIEEWLRDKNEKADNDNKQLR